MSAGLAFAFLAGGAATANPCGFGLLLAYVARQLGIDDGRGRGPGGDRMRAAAVDLTSAP